MKKLFKVALVALCLISATNFAKAQAKIGYVNFGDLIRLMPETKGVQGQMDAYQKTFLDQLTSMNNTFTTEAQAFQKNSATMTDAARTAKQTELQGMQKRLQDFQTDAQQKVEARSNELIKPLSDKARAVVAEIAKEKGYAYVMDSSQIQMLVSPPADDLTAAAKIKLGIK